MMSYSTDIIIHINEKINGTNREQFKKAVLQLQGVVSAEVKNKRPHLLIVGYNPHETKPVDLVKKVRKTGINAQLIAWL